MQSHQKKVAFKRALPPLSRMAATITLLLLPLPCSGKNAGNWTQERQLEIGQPIEREMSGGQVHRYQLALSKGEYLRLVIEQKGIDLEVAVFDPEEKEICRVDSPNGTEGPEVVYLIAKASGSHWLEVRALEKDSAPGRYEAKIETRRLATSRDNSLVAGQQLFAEGMKLWAQGAAKSLRASIDKYQEALGHFRSATELGAEAMTLHMLGIVYYRLSEMKKALDAYFQELPLRQSTCDRDGEASALDNIGTAYNSLGEKQQALDYHGRALSIYRATGNRGGESNSLNNIGTAYDALGEKWIALDYLNQSLQLKLAMGNRNGEAITLNNIGSIYDNLGKKQQALDYYSRSLPIFRALGNRSGEASVLHNLGVIYDSLGERRKALDYYNQALVIFRAMGDRNGEAFAFNDMGLTYDFLGEKQKALDYYNQALSIFRAVGSRNDEASTLNNLGLTYRYLGELQKALDYYNQSLQLRRATGNRYGEAVALNNLGAIYILLGEIPKALSYYDQALQLRRAVGDRNGEAITLNNLGLAYKTLGEAQKALDYHNQALPILRAVGNRNGEASTLNNLGYLYSSRGERQKALDHYDRSLQLSREVEDRRLQAASLSNIGSVYNDAGDGQKAMEYLDPSLKLFRTLGDRIGEALTLYHIGRAERLRGNFVEARAQIETSLVIIEMLRTKVDIHELRASYFATVQSHYEFYLDLLMQMHQQDPSAGFDAAALNVSERARARSLLELLAESRADIREGVDRQLLERERTLQQLLNAKSEYQIRLLSGKHLPEQADAVTKEIDALAIELQNVGAQIRAASPHYAALTQPSPLSIREIQQQLDSNTLLLEYSFGSERSFLWAVTNTTMKSFELPKRAEIESSVRAVYDLLTARNRREKGEAPGAWQRRVADAEAQYAEDAAKLSRMLLGPVARELGNKRLLIVADGALLYLPVAALPSPEPQRKSTPLIVEHEIINLPSASALAVLRRELAGRKPAPLSAAVFGDPVFNIEDPRVSSPKERREGPARAPSSSAGASETEVNLPPLPFSRREAAGIIKLVPQRQGLLALDFKANKATATSPELSRYRIVHFATHGMIDSARPELSGIVLSLIDEQGNQQDGFLRLHELYNLNLPAELVVLSSCRTGLGKEIRGEGLVGLTRGFMYAGAARLVTSLWKVDDEATAELMKRFYAKMLKEDERPAAALRAAQIEMWRQKDWRSPFYWAAFAFQGEWR